MQRIHAAIAIAVLSAGSFVAVVSLWVASQMLVLGLMLVPLWLVLIAMLAG